MASEENEALESVCVLTVTVNQGQRHVGLALRVPRARSGMEDTKLHSLVAYDFDDSPSYPSLEAVLVRWTPSTCHLSEGISDSEAKKLLTVLDCCNITVRRVAKKQFASTSLQQDLCRLLGEDSLARYSAMTSAPLMGPAMGALIAVEGLMAGDNSGRCTLTCAALDEFMRLDAAAVQALNLLPPPRRSASAAAAGKVSSVLGILSRGAWSSGGSRLLKRWLTQPLTDLAQLRTRQNMVELFVDTPVLRDELKDTVRVPDLDSLAARLQRGSATLLDLIRVYNLVLLLPVVVDKLGSYDGPHVETLRLKFIKPLSTSVKEFAQYAAMVEEVIEDVGAPEPRVDPRWDPKLEELKDALTDIEARIAALAEEAMTSWGRGLDVKCERDKTRGYIFRVKKSHDKAVRKLPNVHVCQVLKDGVHFTTEGPRGLKTLGKQLREVEAEYNDKQVELVKKAVDIARSYTPVIEAVAAVVAELDAFNCMAHMAVSAPTPYVRPTLHAPGSADTVLIGARHPVMEFQEGVAFIPNSYTLRRESSRFHIITGPNMGGKSTYIRQLGSIVALAQIGAFVPCDEANIAIVDTILARVGAGDSQLRGVSTFMAEMLEAGCILETATEHSLVIIDELGRGTSTYDGFGLAWAISEHLATKTKCLCMFATHFHELTALADSVPGVRNFHVTAHTTEDTITMLYSVEAGPCPSSFGIHVAELAAFPPSVVEEARKKAQELERLSVAGRELLNKALTAGMPAAGAGAAAADDDGPPSAKRVRTGPSPMDAKDALIHTFLKNVAAVPIDAMTPADAYTKVAALVNSQRDELAAACGITL